MFPHKNVRSRGGGTLECTTRVASRPSDRCIVFDSRALCIACCVVESSVIVAVHNGTPHFTCSELRECLDALHPTPSSLVTARLHLLEGSRSTHESKRSCTTERGARSEDHSRRAGPRLDGSAGRARTREYQAPMPSAIHAQRVQSSLTRWLSAKTWSRVNPQPYTKD